MIVSQAAVAAFTADVWHYYERNGRHELPWRCPEVDGSFDPYKILISEFMLQQTQVSRVLPKYDQFLIAFPTVQALAAAPLAEVLRQWQGLGYNRRAKYIWQAARQVVDEYGGTFPQSPAALRTLPGVGPNTAGALAAYAFNQSVVFIETNIRTVFIHHFFHDQTNIPDKQLLELVTATLPQERKQHSNNLPGGLSRNWYWALMDYGTYLKRTVGNTARASQSYKKQSPLKGSRRAIRGQIIRRLAHGPSTYAALKHDIEDDRLEAVLVDLCAEGLIRRSGQQYRLSD